MTNLDLMKSKYMSNRQVKNDSDLGGMKARLLANGGYHQQERMIFDKKRSLDRSLFYSYQGADIQKLGDTGRPCRALINPDKLKFDYDDKILSVNFDYDIKEGDIFEWVGTNSYWLVYLRDIDEVAYFRSEIRRCRYEIAWELNGQQYRSYAAVRGPVETKIDYIQKHGISVDNPNETLHILMPLTDEAKEYFTRYSKFYLQDDKICWRVQATDYLSTPGILEMTAEEYYANKDEDDIDNGVVGALIVDPIDPNPIGDPIQGETFIKPRKNYIYTYGGNENIEWSIDKKYPVEIMSQQGNSITIRWKATMSGQFELKCGGATKTIVVESLF